MKVTRTSFPLILATVAVAVYASGNVMAKAHHPAGGHQQGMEHHHELKVGKKGDLTLPERTMIGKIALEPGRYKFQHREEGGAHYVGFVAIGSHTDSGDVPCKLEPLDKKARNTSVFTDRSVEPPRIVKVVVRGEKVAHVF